MQHEIKNKQNKIWFIAYSEDLIVFHYGEIQPFGVMRTGQPVLEQFETEQEWAEAIIQLKGQEFYDTVVKGQEEIEGQDIE